LELATDERWAIEIKKSSAPKVSKGFYTACKDIKATRKIVVYAGEDSFPMGEEIEAMGLQSFMREILPSSA
jgi:hypothetical protein